MNLHVPINRTCDKTMKYFKTNMLQTNSLFNVTSDDGNCKILSSNLKDYLHLHLVFMKMSALQC